MTIERDLDTDATVRMPMPLPATDDFQDIEPFDPEKTIAREDWESTVIRRVAPRVAAVQREVAEDAAGEARYGWEGEVLRRLSREVFRAGE